jgi:uncharacterized membrane protein YciS (DUF1049 family)
MVVVILVVALLIVLATLAFAIANGVPVTVNLIFGQLPTQLSLAIIVPFVAGLLVGVLVMVPGTIKNTLTIASHKRRISTLEKNAPSKESPAAETPES